MSTILKWAGNKTAIMSELKKYLPAGPRLVEPFAGSCAVMMATDYPSYLVADINPDLINLYKKIAADCEAFISRARVLFEEANSELAYYNIRQEFNYSTEITDFMKAIYFLYLNRHGYRGLCRYNKSGHFNIPYGNYKNPYFPEKEIRAFAEKAPRATFICASFDETLAMLKAGDVVYCDPPYDGTFSGYHTDGFTEDDQYHLASVLEHRSLALLRRGLASSGNAAGLLTAPLSSLRRTASLTGNVLKTVAGAPVALLQSGLSGLRAVAVMFMNPLAVLRGGLAAAGTVLRVLASGPLAMLRVALYAVSGLLGALLSPIGLVVTALAGVALVVWKYWQPITAFLGGVVEGFKAAAGPVSAAFEPLKPVFQWIGDKVQALWGWFTDLLTPIKTTSAELQSAAAMGRRFGEALAEGLNMVMHPLDSLKSGVSWLLEKLGIVSKEAAKAKLPESVTRQQPATVNADGKVMIPSGGFPSWGYGFAGMYDSGGYIPRGQFGIVGENGPEIVNGPANVTSRRNTAALAAVVAGMMGVAAAPAELPPLHPLALPAKGGEAIVSRAATVPPVYRIEAPTQIIIQTQPGQSAQDIAREVARQLDERERRLKAKARSNYSDQGGYDA